MSESEIALRPASACAPVISAAPSASRERAIGWIKWAFSFPAMLGAALVARVFYDVRNFFVDPDLWWHLRNGELILATHRWPITDPYSFTVHGRPWLLYEWLGEVAIAGFYRIGGLIGLETFLIVVGSMVAIALYVLATIRSGNSKAAFVAAGLASCLMTGQFTLRPQMLAYLFLILALIILGLFRKGKQSAIWFFPALMLIWVNTHGSWEIGIGILFVFWIGGLFRFQLGGIVAQKWTATERRKISLAFLLSVAVLPLTPYGTRLAAVPFQMATSTPIGMANISEWRPMPFDQPDGKIFLALVLGFFLAQFAMKLDWRFDEVALLFGSTVLACIHLRCLLIFVPLFVPLLARVFASWLRPYARAKDKYILNGILMAAMAGGIIHYFPSRTFIESKVAEAFPVEAVAYIHQHPIAGPMLDNYGFGGYLVWSGQQVFIDGRADLYEYEGVLNDYMQLMMMKPGGLDVLRRYHIESCLLQKDEPLSVVLTALPDWQQVYSDKTSAIFVRRKPWGGPSVSGR
jgi:hypothetical protein